jgi:hypothetical protein
MVCSEVRKEMSAVNVLLSTIKEGEDVEGDFGRNLKEPEGYVRGKLVRLGVRER